MGTAFEADAIWASNDCWFLMNDNSKQIYKVIFLNQGEIFEIYAKNIYQSDLFGFVEVEEFLFGERTKMVVDPSEEKLKSEFEDVVRSFIPVGAIIRIDEVEKEGKARVTSAGDKVTPFPIQVGPSSPTKK